MEKIKCKHCAAENYTIQDIKITQVDRHEDDVIRTTVTLICKEYGEKFEVTETVSLSIYRFDPNY